MVIDNIYFRVQMNRGFVRPNDFRFYGLNETFILEKCISCTKQPEYIDDFIVANDEIPIDCKVVFIDKRKEFINEPIPGDELDDYEIVLPRGTELAVIDIVGTVIPQYIISINK